VESIKYPEHLSRDFHFGRSSLYRQVDPEELRRRAGLASGLTVNPSGEVETMTDEAWRALQR
jgi:hypothetical protein